MAENFESFDYGMLWSTKTKDHPSLELLLDLVEDFNTGRATRLDPLTEMYEQDAYSVDPAGRIGHTKEDAVEGLFYGMKRQPRANITSSHVILVKAARFKEDGVERRRSAIPPQDPNAPRGDLVIFEHELVFFLPRRGTSHNGWHKIGVPRVIKFVIGMRDRECKIWAQQVYWDTKVLENRKAQILKMEAEQTRPPPREEEDD